MKRLFFGLPVLFLFVWGCDYGPDFDDGTYGPGVYIINEGSGSSNSTISFIDRFYGGVTPDIYQNATGHPINGKLQSMLMVGGTVYLVCENKIELVDYLEFQELGTISGLMGAQQMLIDDTVAYVSEMRNPTDTGWIRKISLFTHLAVDTLKVGIGPKYMLFYEDRIFVSNSNDSNITVVDRNTFTVETEITVDFYPESMHMDANGFIWVLCTGRPPGDPNGPPSPGSIHMFNPATLGVANVITFPATGGNPNFLRPRKDWEEMYYYFNNGIYKMDVDATTLPTVAFIDAVGVTNGLGIDPHTGFVYVADKKNGSDEGRLRWYNGSTGLWVDSANTGGSLPDEFYFIQP